MEEQRQIPVSMNPIFHYVSNVQIGAGEEEFVLALTSGNQVFQFVMSPKHMKRVKLLLDKNIDEYEKNFGKLETKLPEVKKGTMEKNKMGF